MTPAERIALVADAYQKSRHYWTVTESSNEDARSISFALVEAGLVAASRESDARIRILKVIETMCTNYEGRFTEDDLATEVLLALGIVSGAELEGVA